MRDHDPAGPAGPAPDSAPARAPTPSTVPVAGWHGEPVAPSALDYPFGDTVPLPGASLEVASGLRWHRIPLDGSPDHVNLWLVEEADGWTAVDCGVVSEASRAAWEGVVASLPRAPAIVRVLVTHLHSDHLGLADGLCERWGAPLWMSRADHLQARRATEAPREVLEATLGLLARNGFCDAAAADAIRAREPGSRARMPRVPASARYVSAGETLRVGDRDWRAIPGHGHAPEHLSYHCAALGVLVAGDMLLPAITAHVGVIASAPDADPLADYLASITRFAALPPDTLVLPSHGRPFRGIDTRLAQVRARLARRLDETLAACDTPRSAAELLPDAVRRGRLAHRAGLALTGTLAVLHHLWHAGLLRRTQDPDGVLRFSRVDA
jgi:glyoxylase-like metal-dependent hydrolase (beta-lactamase superfamily II)